LYLLEVEPEHKGAPNPLVGVLSKGEMLVGFLPKRGHTLELLKDNVTCYIMNGVPTWSL
jgi:hypothetical protein